MRGSVRMMYMPLWRAQRGLTLQTNTGDIAEELRRRAAEPPTPAVKGPGRLGCSFSFVPPLPPIPKKIPKTWCLSMCWSHYTKGHLYLTRGESDLEMGPASSWPHKLGGCAEGPVRLE